MAALEGNTKIAVVGLGVLAVAGFAFWIGRSTASSAADPPAKSSAGTQTTSSSTKIDDPLPELSSSTGAQSSSATQPVVPSARGDDGRDKVERHALPGDELLPDYLQGRPFKLADGGFLALWNSQQADEALIKCWRPLEQGSEFPPRSIAFRIQIDAAGQIENIKPSIRQAPGVRLGGSPGTQNGATLLAACLEPFVRATQFPPNAAQQGEVLAVRPTPKD